MEGKLRIGIDLTGIWRPATGIFVYAIELTRELVCADDQNAYTLFFAGEIHPEFQEIRERFRPVVVPIRGELLGKQLLMSAACGKADLDLLHFPAFPPCVACRHPYVWTLHDATPWLRPETMDWKGRLYFRHWGRIAATRSRAIITVSNQSREDIVRFMPELAPRISVIHSGLDSKFSKVDDVETRDRLRNRYHLPEHFILTVATLEPRKNVPFLLEGYARLCQSLEKPPGLVIAGRSGWNMDNVNKHLASAGADIVVTGFVPKDDLVGLYNLADVFVLPSLYEGFGFPPLEAMACGCPVVLSNRGALPEIAGDAALFIDPECMDSFVSAVRLVLMDPELRTSLVQRGFKRAGHFSWNEAAKGTVQLYRKALNVTDSISQC